MFHLVKDTVFSPPSNCMTETSLKGNSPFKGCKKKSARCTPKTTPSCISESCSSCLTVRKGKYKMKQAIEGENLLHLLYFKDFKNRLDRCWDSVKFHEHPSSSAFLSFRHPSRYFDFKTLQVWACWIRTVWHIRIEWSNKKTPTKTSKAVSSSLQCK